MKTFNQYLEKFKATSFVYFLAALFFVFPFLLMFPYPMTFVMAFGFLVMWVKWVGHAKKEI